MNFKKIITYWQLLSKIKFILNNKKKIFSKIFFLNFNRIFIKKIFYFLEYLQLYFTEHKII
jgi:hypothetical protein